MQIISYKHIVGTERFPGQITIPELDRHKPATPQFIELADLDIELTCPTAFIFVAGSTIDQSESGLGKGTGNFSPALKSTSAYVAHQWLTTFKGKEKFLTSMDVTTSTCASAIEAIAMANLMIVNPYDKTEEVIIIGHERTTPDTVRLFKELGIKVTCGDGFVYMKLREGHDISKPQWKWAYNDNPFVFTRETLNNLIPAYKVGYVKLHQTGTVSNTEAESDLADLATPIGYKSEIGHTQGISALLETCMVLDDPTLRGRILVVANGLGGYYGSFTLTKPNART